jgi:uncharacterized protein YndB with AHSA1/START domain
MRPVIFATVMWSLAAGAAGAQDVSPLVHTGVIEASIADVWRVWTTSDGLREWIAPHAEIDLRLGGFMRTNYNAKGRLGDPGTIENTVLAYEPMRMLAMRVAKPPAGFPFPNAVQKMWSILYLDPIGIRNTRVRAVTLGFDASEESQKMRAFFQRGNTAELAKLQKYFAEKPATKLE